MALSRERDLRRSCRKLLAELDIQPPLDVVTLCQRLGERRGKPIKLVPYPIPVPGPFGMWIATADADYILYQQETTDLHQRHIIVHELGHIIADHSGDEEDDSLMSALFRAGGLPPNVIRRVLRRTAYDTEQERAAEMVADIILGWASVADSIAPQPQAGQVAQRIGTTLSHRLGWL